MEVEVEGVQFEVKGSRWRLRECSFRLMWRKWRLRGFSLRLGGAGRGDVVRG